MRINWHLFRVVLSRIKYTLGFSIFLLAFGIFIGTLIALKGTGHQDKQTLTSAVTFLLGLGYFVLFLSLSEKIRSLLVFDFNHNLPEFRSQLLITTATVFLIFYILPVVSLISLQSITFSQALTLYLGIGIVLVGGLFNQTVGGIIGIVVLIQLQVLNKNNGSMSESHLEQLFFLITSIVLSVVYYNLIKLAPKHFFGTKRSKKIILSEVMDPLISQNVMTKFLRRNFLSARFSIQRSLNKNSPSVSPSFWNYQFTSLNFIRGLFFVIAVFSLISQSNMAGDFVQGFADGSSGKPVEFSVIATIISYLLLIFFGMFDGSILGEFPNAARFLWLKKSEDGLKPFVRSLYRYAALRAFFEIVGSLFAMMVIMSAFGMQHFNLEWMLVAFLTIKLINLALIQRLPKENMQRWSIAIITIVNLLVIALLISIQNQQIIEVMTGLIAVFGVSLLISSTILVREFKVRANY